MILKSPHPNRKEACQTPCTCMVFSPRSRGPLKRILGNFTDCFEPNGVHKIPGPLAHEPIRPSGMHDRHTASHTSELPSAAGRPRAESNGVFDRTGLTLPCKPNVTGRTAGTAIWDGATRPSRPGGSPVVTRWQLLAWCPAWERLQNRTREGAAWYRTHCGMTVTSQLGITRSNRSSDTNKRRLLHSSSASAQRNSLTYGPATTTSTTATTTSIHKCEAALRRFPPTHHQPRHQRRLGASPASPFP